MSCKVALPMMEDFSHFEGVSPLPFPEAFPSWPSVDPAKSESLPNLEHGQECIDAPVLLSFASMKEPPMLLSFGSGKEPPAFLSFISGKEVDIRDFTADIAASISGSCVVTAASAGAFLQAPVLSVTSSSPSKPSTKASSCTVIGSQFSETLLLPVSVVKSEPKEEKAEHSDASSKATAAKAKAATIAAVAAGSATAASSAASSVSASSSAVSCESTASSSQVSSSPLSLLALLDGDRKVLPERKAKERKTVKREREEKKREEKKQPLFSNKRGRKKRTSDDSDGSEFDSNDSGCWAESKKERNKKAASNYRKRRKQYVNELEAKVQGLSEKAAKESESVSAMTDEIQTLKDRIECLESLLSDHNVEIPRKKSACNKAKRAKN